MQALRSIASLTRLGRSLPVLDRAPRVEAGVCTLALLLACPAYVGAHSRPFARATSGSARRGLPSRRSRIAPLPLGWPHALVLGLADPPQGAGALAASGGFAVRYQYLSGGVNTGKGWQTWDPGATFVAGYIEESLAEHLLPVFSYYMLRQSSPGGALGDDRDADLTNLVTPATMRAWFRDLEVFLRHAAAFAPHPVVLHVEPDLWGYLEQTATADDARTVRALVSATGLPELSGLPNNASGLARAIVRLRDRLAPNVQLAYHLSVFGTGKDLLYDKPPPEEVDQLAARSARFYRSLHARFDVIFAELANHDAGYGEVVLHDHGASWWQPADYERERRYLADVVRLTGKRVVLWQIPIGNTLMRAMNSTRFHYQDNHVQWLLDDPTRRHLRAFARAGVIALLFGPALPGETCACDADHDGIVNPAPIDGNTLRSYSSDDDGGFLRARARAYARQGALRLE